MKSSLLFVLVVFFLIGSIVFFENQKDKQKLSSEGSVSISTSFYPLYFFAKEIVGGDSAIHNITPSGAEPHDYEPTASDLVKIKNSKILLINGVTFEPWSKKVKEMFENESLEIVEVADSIASNNDPHVWLDPVLASLQVDKIEKTLSQVDQSNKNYYEKNANKLKQKLEELNQSFEYKLKNCKSNTIVTSHTAFSYVAKRYGLKQISISGFSPDEEPSSRQIADVSKLAQQNNIKYIFFETLVSPKLSETVAREIGAKTLVLNPLEGLTPEEIEQGEDYFSLQQKNLKNLTIALECK